MKRKFWIGFLIFLIISCIWETVLFMTQPESRTGPLGIGLPAKMKAFESKTFGLSIQYPESWVAFEMTGGNHGDREVIVAISAPGRSFPNVRISEHELKNGDLDQVRQWGLTKIDNIKGLQAKDIKIGSPIPMVAPQ